ncbi:MAG: hypothetical protein JXR07_13275 [Reichenbachiella sp.]
MIGKYLVKLKTKFALKRNDAIRISDGFQNAKKIGVIYTQSVDLDMEVVNEFIKKLESAGKTVQTITFISKVKKTDSFDFPFFTENDFSANGKWRKPEVENFKKEAFDYLISLDQETNKYTRNILASSKAKCRVGKFEEGFDQYFELMIDHSDNNFEAFIDQLFHYLKSVRNG